MLTLLWLALVGFLSCCVTFVAVREYYLRVAAQKGPKSNYALLPFEALPFIEPGLAVLAVPYRGEQWCPEMEYAHAHDCVCPRCSKIGQ